MTGTIRGDQRVNDLIDTHAMTRDAVTAFFAEYDTEPLAWSLVMNLRDAAWMAHRGVDHLGQPIPAEEIAGMLRVLGWVRAGITSALGRPS